MNTINAQTIINQVMAAHAIAPSEYTWGDFITFKTSERGTHRVLNCKENLQRFADAVRKNAAAFGGGIVREAKEKPAVSYPSKTISLYKQLLEDRDYFAALQLAEEKLSPLFFVGTNGRAYMQVAPIICDFEPRMVSVMNEDGRWAIVDPVSMIQALGNSRKNLRSRDAQIAEVKSKFDSMTFDKVSAIFAKIATVKPDQSAIRAQWMADHGIVDDAAIEARIDAQAAQDVAEIVAQAVAVSAIADAMAPSEESTPEIVTCEAGESEAQESSTGSASTVPAWIRGCEVGSVETMGAYVPAFTPVPDYPVATTPAVSRYQEILADLEKRASRIGVDKTIEETRANLAGMILSRNFGESIGDFFARNPYLSDKNRAYTDWLNGAKPDTLQVETVLTPAVAVSSGTVTTTPAVSSEPPAPRPVESTAEPVAPVVETEAQEAPDTLEDFTAGDGVSYELCEAIERATTEQVQAMTDAQFQKLYDHLENWNFHTENYLLEALRLGDESIIADIRQVIQDQKESGYLRSDIHARRMAICERMNAANQANATPVNPAATPDDTQKFRVRAKSGEWRASFIMIGTMYALLFNGDGSKVVTTTYATHAERMQALEMMANALNTPPDGGQPIEPVEEHTPPVAECTPDTPPMENRAEFERIKPFNMDPRKLLEHGVQAAQLIGLGVKYTGNMASPDGQGAITSVEDTRGEKFGSLRLNCTLEDGRVFIAEPHYFTAELRPIMQFNGKMHGTPYLSELAMAATLAKSQRTSADELRKQAHDQALIDLAAQYPQLKRAETTYSGGKLAAQNIRILLKEAFKGQKFSVTSDYSEVRVNWTDGPTDAEVTEIIGRFDIGASDTQSDYFYTVETAFSELFGGVQYLWTKRETSDELVQQAIDALYSNRSNGKPKVDDYRKCTGIFDWNSQNYENRRMRETLGSISAYTAPKGKAKA